MATMSVADPTAAQLGVFLSRYTPEQIFIIVNSVLRGQAMDVARAPGVATAPVTTHVATNNPASALVPLLSTNIIQHDPAATPTAPIPRKAYQPPKKRRKTTSADNAVEKRALNSWMAFRGKYFSLSIEPGQANTCKPITLRSSRPSSRRRSLAL